MIFFGRFGLVCILVFTMNIRSDGQSVVNLFRLLPSTFTPELNSKEKEILIEKGEYIVPGGDSDETVQYTMDTTASKNYLRCEYSFTTGQRAFIISELKKLRKADGEFILVFSQYGGVPIEIDQREFKIYEIKKGKLVESRNIKIPGNASLKSLLKTGYTDSLLTAIGSCTNYSFLLDSENEDEIEFRISSPLTLEDYKKYMIGNVILFTWNGRSFVRRVIWD